MTLRHSILRTFLIFQLLILIPGIAFVVISFTDGQDSLQLDVIEAESSAFINNYKKDPTTALPQSNSFSTYIGTTAMPKKYQDLVEQLPPGLVEVDVYGKYGFPEEREVKINVYDINNGKPYFYFISDISEERAARILQRNIVVLIITYLSISLLLGALCAWLFSIKISRPLEIICEKISQSKPDNLESNLSSLYSEGEMGMLSKALDEKDNRIADFIHREQEVMRNISHELRTPITVIKSTLSLARVDPNALGDNKLIEKMERASGDLEAMIEAFLWLGRENIDKQEKMDCAECVETAISDLIYLIEGKDIQLALNIDHNVSVHCKEQVFYIAVANLLRNAFSYTESGTIKIDLNSQQFTVSDTGPGISPQLHNDITKAEVQGGNSTGFGLGLHIVSQICRRMDWTLDIKNNESGIGAQAKILIK